MWQAGKTNVCLQWILLQNDSSFFAACLTLTVILVCCRSFHLFHPSPSVSVLSPPTCFTLFTNSPNCIALSVSVQLCYPTQTVLSPSVFLPPNLLFVLRCLQHSLVMFFFLRSHFRTSEGDQEKIGLRKPAVKGSSAPFALQISAQHCETFRPSSSLSVKQVVSRSTCLVWLFDASTLGELAETPAPDPVNQGLVIQQPCHWLASSSGLFSIHAAPPTTPCPSYPSSPDSHTSKHTLASLP